MRFRLVVVCAASMLATPARADDFKIYHPYAEDGEWDMESAGAVTRDNRRDKNDIQTFSTAIGYGVTAWWATEVEGEWNKSFDGQTRFDALNWENIFQFAEQGENWVDIGLFASYGRGLKGDKPDVITIGPILEKEYYGTTTTVDLFLTKEIGSNSDGRVAAEYGIQSYYRWQWTELVSPGFQAFGDLGPVAHIFDRGGEQQHRIGPALIGVVDTGFGRVAWNVAYLFGLNDNTEHGAPKFGFEWQLPF